MKIGFQPKPWVETRFQRYEIWVPPHFFGFLSHFLGHNPKIKDLNIRSGQYGHWLRSHPQLYDTLSEAYRSGVLYIGIFANFGVEPVTSAKSMVQGGYNTKWYHEIKNSLDAIEDTVKCYMFLINRAGAEQQKQDMLTLERTLIQNMSGMTQPLFKRQVVNVNVPNYPHIDTKNMPGILSWTCPFGNYIGAHMIVPQLGRMFKYPPNSICGLDGRNLVHFATDWGGENAERYVVGVLILYMTSYIDAF